MNKSIAADLPDNIQRTRFVAKIPLEDLPHFQKFKENSLAELYSEFSSFYSGRYANQHNALNDLSLDESGSVEEFVASKMNYYDNFCLGMTMKEKVTDLHSNFPQEISTEMIKYRKSIFDVKATFFNHFFHVCRLNKSILNVPILKSDRLLLNITSQTNEININTDCSGNNQKSLNESFLSNMDVENEIVLSVKETPEKEYPDKVNFSIFETLIKDLPK